MTTVGVVALQGAVSEHVGMLVALGATVREIRTPEALNGVDGLVLPGGESTAMARAGAATGLFEEVRARREAGLPCFGTCAGLVLIADRVQDDQALRGLVTVGGLDVTARRNAFGGQLSSFTAPLHVSAFPDRVFPAVFIRAPQVVEVGPGVEVLARMGKAGHVVAVRQDHLLTTAFHPELTGDDRFHRLFLGMCAAPTARRVGAASPQRAENKQGRSGLPASTPDEGVLHQQTLRLVHGCLRGPVRAGEHPDADAGGHEDTDGGRLLRHFLRCGAVPTGSDGGGAEGRRS